MGNIIGSGLELYIKRDARDTALNRVAEAERRAQEIRAQAQQRIELMRGETSRNTALRVEQNRQRLLAQADLSAKQIRMDRRAEIMRQVWDQVTGNLHQEVPDDERLRLLRNGLADAAQQLGGGALEITVNAQDAALIDDDILATWCDELDGVTDIALADEPADIIGGVIVRQREARRLVDNSWNERLSLAQRTLQDQVHQRLTDNK